MKGFFLITWSLWIKLNLWINLIDCYLFIWMNKYGDVWYLVSLSLDWVVHPTKGIRFLFGCKNLFFSKISCKLHYRSIGICIIVKFSIFISIYGDLREEGILKFPFEILWWPKRKGRFLRSSCFEIHGSMVTSILNQNRG